MNILFVCSGNVSRSFLAEILFKRAVEALKLDDFSVSSAGIYAYPGNPPDPGIVKYLKEHHIPFGNHRARQIQREDAEWADRILVMEHDHLRFLERRWPDIQAKLEHFGAYLSTGQRPDDIIDPFGGSSYHYRLAQAQITMAVKALLERLVPNPAGDHHDEG